MSIAFITNDWVRGDISGKITPGGCAYYRCYLPATVSGQRARLGYPAWDGIRGFGVRENNNIGVFGFQNIMLKLIMDKWTPAMIERAQGMGQHIYVDVDDHYDGLTEANLAYEMTHPDKNRRTNRDHYHHVIMAADTVTVSTPFLYDWLSKQRDNVHLIRNGVDPELFQPIKHINRKPVIGWVGVTGFRNNDLEQLREWLPDFLEEHDLMFHHAGHDPNYPHISDIIGVDPKRITTSPTVPIWLYDNILEFDIGLVPLNNIPFNEAKSNIKGLEYAAKGIPFIASPLPEYRALHETGAGSLAETPEQWKAQATRLLDYKQRRSDANRARSAVLEYWSIYCRTAEWQAVFNRTETHTTPQTDQYDQQTQTA